MAIESKKKKLCSYVFLALIEFLAVIETIYMRNLKYSVESVDSHIICEETIYSTKTAKKKCKNLLSF